jgi:hypothetical protein
VLPQVPAVPQVCGCSGFDVLHCAAPGVHTPEQAPLTHAWLVHVAGFPHWPLVLHVSTPLFEHCTAPGVHVPEQAPLTHAWLVHVAGLPHWPLALHVSTPLFEHCTAPGVHATHAPERHTVAPPVHACAVPHCPAAVHVSTPPPLVPPEHCVAPGVHTPAHAPPLHT